ncbi:MAG: heavy metal translocating P-type ATPase [Mucilaginibacter sp.]|uniref:heavy metal translocating P-type ATPase n=1 Tax=Mucilaginibacter sp. TaxID=1882438 RepID=UPI0034E6013E
MEKNILHKTYPVTGMSCASCAMSVQSTANQVPGVAQANVNYATQALDIYFNPKQTEPQQIQKAIQNAGYDLILDEENALSQQEEQQEKALAQLKKQTWGAILLTVPIVLLDMVFMHWHWANLLMLVLTSVVLFVFGKRFFINAWKQAKHFHANMDTLVAISTGVAYLFSLFNTIYPAFWFSRGVQAHVYFEAAAVVITFILIGKLLEERAKSGTSASVKKLMGLQVRTVRVIRNGIETEVDIKAVQEGELVRIKPGERIPVDGEIYEGNSFIDEAMMTGEPMPVARKAGDAIFAGTINQKGSFVLKALKVGNQTMLSRMIKAVQNAQGSKAKVQKLADQIASVFVPVVFGIAIISAIAWWVFGGTQAFSQGLLAFVTVLIVACPCALGLATPTAIMVGVGKGAEKGILIRDAETLERAYRVNTIVLDKTGTITEGKPKLTALNWNKNLDLEQQKVLAGVLMAAELHSEHPLADAIVDSIRVKEASAQTVADFKSTTGAGIAVIYQNENYLIGKPEWVQENSNLTVDQTHFPAANAADTVIYFGKKNTLLAVLTIADEVRANAAATIAKLKKSGIEVWMLTGDAASTAKHVAAKTGIENVVSGVSPSGKAEQIKKLQQQGKVVAMAGDGINDAEALATADVSIAMGLGSDIAMDVARITLVSSNLTLLPEVFQLSAQTIQTIRQNLFWAFIYNVIAIPVAAGALYPIWGIYLDPMFAGAAMALSSVSVVSNSLRLKWKK